MKKTNKVLALVFAVVLILYAGSIGTLYIESRKGVKSGATSEIMDLFNSFNLDSYKNLDSVTNSLNQNSCVYPTRYYIYDESGKKCLAKSFNEIAFTRPPLMDDETINLDEYLSKDKLTELANMSKKYGENYSTFKFAIENGKVIPCSLTFRILQPYGHDGETFYFTDKKPTDEISCLSHYFNMEIYSLLGSDFMLEDYDYIDAKYKAGKVNKAEMPENKDTNVNTQSDIDYSDEYFSKDGRYIIKEALEFATEDGNVYNLITYTALNIFENTVHYYLFTNWAIGLSCFFAVMLAVSLASAYSIMKKEQMKYAKYSFSNAAAHELKTPLAIIQNRCELVMENVNESKNGEYVKSIYEESIRMNKLIKNLLQYNSLTMNTDIDKKECDLDRIVKKEIEKYRPLSALKDVGIEDLACEKCRAKCNDELISLVIDNFLSNAVKFAEPKSVIKVSLNKKGKKFRLGVYNQGETISKQQGKELWELLYKGDMSRSRDENSSGMGLAICRQILELHNFKYGFENKENGVEFYFIAK